MLENTLICTYSALVHALVHCSHLLFHRVEYTFVSVWLTRWLYACSAKNKTNKNVHTTFVQKSREFLYFLSFLVLPSAICRLFPTHRSSRNHSDSVRRSKVLNFFGTQIFFLLWIYISLLPQTNNQTHHTHSLTHALASECSHDLLAIFTFLMCVNNWFDGCFRFS